jgi:hypothetical protein
MTLAVMGYHFQVMTRRISGASSIVVPAADECLPDQHAS